MEVQAALQLAWLLIVLMHLMLGKFNSVLVFVLFFYLLLYSTELGVCCFGMSRPVDLHQLFPTKTAHARTQLCCCGSSCLCQLLFYCQ